MKSTAFITPAAIALDPSRAQPLHRQLYEQLRAAILTSALKPGTRLPSIRMSQMRLRSTA